MGLRNNDFVLTQQSSTIISRLFYGERIRFGWIFIFHRGGCRWSAMVHHHLANTWLVWCSSMSAATGITPQSLVISSPGAKQHPTCGMFNRGWTYRYCRITYLVFIKYSKIRTYFRFFLRSPQPVPLGFVLRGNLLRYYWALLLHTSNYFLFCLTLTHVVPQRSPILYRPSTPQ